MAEEEYVVHTFEYSFQLFSDELEVHVADFENSKSESERLSSHISDISEREAMQKRVNDVSDRLEAIQRLVLDKERSVGDRYYQLAEFEVGFKDCRERMEEYKASLCELQSDHLPKEERMESFQVCKYVLFALKNTNF